jgi:hypothetical protein
MSSSSPASSPASSPPSSPVSPVVPGSLTGLSSMATRALLAELGAAWHERSGKGVRIE